MDRAVGHRDLPPLEVDDELAAGNARLRAGSGTRYVPEGNADTRKKLVDSERLRHVVVRAEIERVHLVGLAAARRENDDRSARVLADATDHLEAVAVGQVQVQDHEIGLPPFVAGDRVAGRLGGLHLKTVTAQVRAERPHHRWLVVDDEQTCPGWLRARRIK